MNKRVIWPVNRNLAAETHSSEWCFFFIFVLLFSEWIDVTQKVSLENDRECRIPGVVEHGTVKENIRQCRFLEIMLHKWQTSKYLKYKYGSKDKKIIFCCPAQKSVQECRKFGKNPGITFASRIIGGSFAKFGEFPFFASLGYICKTEQKELFFSVGAPWSLRDSCWRRDTAWKGPTPSTSRKFGHETKNSPSNIEYLFLLNNSHLISYS